MTAVTIVATALYAIVGGPSVGKTSIIEELKEMGEETVREVAGDYIMERQEMGSAAPWSEDDFQLVILHRHLDREKTAVANSKRNNQTRIFSDRGILDGYVYSKIRNQEDMPVFQQIKNIISGIDVPNHYDVVFFILPHGGDEFQTEVHRGRPEATDEALRISELTWDVYRKYCPNVVEVPARMTPRERAEFIVAQVESRKKI